MMKRPWQIWLLLAVCLALALPAMSWLTLKTLELERSEIRARQQAELEERVSLALWKMDTLLTPIIGQEAVRPYAVYQSFYLQPTTNNKAHFAPSPLLEGPGQHAYVHFELTEANHWKSPQIPQINQQKTAEAFGVDQQTMLRCTAAITDLQKSVSHEQLLGMLSQQILPEPRNASPQPQSTSSYFASNSTEQKPQLSLNDSPQFFENPSAQQELNANEPQGEPVVSQQEQTAQPTAQQPQQRQQATSLDTRNDLMSRIGNYQKFAQKDAWNQRKAYQSVTLTQKVAEGVSRPVWIDGKLILARRVHADGKELIQGCWLNWNYLKELLLAEIADIFPAAELEPVSANGHVGPSRMLAGLPVQLVVPISTVGESHFTPMRIALYFAWICLILTSLAIAALLSGVVTLSERRASFVSAVTHELRTPLTTFRMYAEMLANNMITDEQKKSEYLHTLQHEADRLYHLVENVLSFARLEKNGSAGRLQTITLADIYEQIHSRLEERANQAGLQLILQEGPDLDSLRVKTDLAAVEQILFNLVDNACKYAANRKQPRIQLTFGQSKNMATIEVTDHGPGISQSVVRKLFRPFSKSDQEAANSAPGVGLGLALCKRLARQIGGRLSLASTSEQGTTFSLCIPLAKQSPQRSESP